MIGQTASGLSYRGNCTRVEGFAYALPINTFEPTTILSHKPTVYALRVSRLNSCPVNWMPIFRGGDNCSVFHKNLVRLSMLTPS